MNGSRLYKVGHWMDGVCRLDLILGLAQLTLVNHHMVDSGSKGGHT